MQWKLKIKRTLVVLFAGYTGPLKWTREKLKPSGRKKKEIDDDSQSLISKILHKQTKRVKKGEKTHRH